MSEQSLGLSRNDLSDDAKSVLSAYFSRDPVMAFGMTDRRPTATMQAALDELVGANVIRREPDGRGGVSYRRLLDCSAYIDWLSMNPHAGTWDVDEPIPERAVAA